MKTIIALTTVLLSAGIVVYSATSEGLGHAAFLTAADVAVATKQLPPKAAVDRALRTLDAGAANVGIFIVHRPEEPDQGCTIEHDTLENDKTTSILFVLDGAGTIVTGGKLINPTPLAPDDPDLPLLGNGSRGTGIQGGESRRITKGDIVIIPAGVPHGLSAIEKSITYEVVRVDSGKSLAVK
jgi:Cupin